MNLPPSISDNVVATLDSSISLSVSKPSNVVEAPGVVERRETAELNIERLVALVGKVCVMF